MQDSINCDNNEYCFKVVNTTDPEIIIRSVEFIQLSPTGASMTPNPYSINPLMSGDTSEWICINYNSLGSPDLCFLLVGHEADLPAGDPITWCCVDDEKYFINIEDDCGPPCPTVPNICDDIFVSMTPHPITGDECCFVGTVTNDYCAEYFKGVKISTQSPASIAQVQTINGWYINQISGTEAEIYPSGNYVTLGTENIFTVCNSSNVTPFVFTISWLVPDGMGNCIEECTEDFNLNCPGIPLGGCITIIDEELNCDDDQFCFKITNNTNPGFEIRSVDLVSITPAGTTLSPNPISIPPLMSGQTSDWICVDYGSVVDGEEVCFYVVAHNNDVTQGEIPTWCCASQESSCFEVDCGDPCPSGSNTCDDISVTLTSDPITGEECCFVGNITNDYCADYFKGIKISTQSPAQLTQVQALNGWYINLINSTEAELYPAGNHVDLGTFDIFSVCNTSNINPFIVTIAWLVDDGQGNCIEECNEDFQLDCPDIPDGGCITVTEEDLLCEQNMYCFKITNNTNPGFTLRSIDLISISPSGTTLSPNPISIPDLPAGQTSDWICVEYGSVADGEEVCFYVVGHNEDVTQGNVPTWCCATQEPSCFTIECGDFCPPDCISVIQDSISCEDRNYCFKIVNNTHPSFEINSVDLINILPQTASFLNTPVSIPTLMAGDTSDWICVEYAGVMPDDTLCFNVVAHLEDLGSGENPSWCCSASVQTCVVIDDCETCCQDEQGFIDLVDLGFDVTLNQCEVNIITSQFDSCHWLPYAEPDWGDGSVASSVVTPANGNWTHNYAAPGTYNICMDFYEGEFGESNCWQYTYCMEVTVDCNNFNEQEDECDLNLLTVPNGLTPNGDGLNEILIIERQDDCPPLAVTIYNRWGQMVFESNAYQNDWSGLSRSGNELPDGTYYLVVGYDDERTKVINSFIDVRR